MKHNNLSLKTIFIRIYFWKWPYFSIAHARNFGQVTSLIVHDPLHVRKIKPQTLLTKTSKYGGRISNNKVCRFICFKQSRGDRLYQKSAIFISPQKWLDRSTRFCWFSAKLLGDVLGTLCNWICDETTVWAWTLFLFIFFSENYHILTLGMRGISVKWPH